jgi:hypothetical protein
MGGVVTLADVANKTATRVGRTFASLLNSGFPLRTTLSIARQETVSGYRYITLGNGGQSLVQSDGGIPTWTSITTRENKRYCVNIDTFLDPRCQFGSTYTVNTLASSSRTIVSNDVCFENIAGEKLKHFLELEHQPAVIDNQLRWNPVEFLD